MHAHQVGLFTGLAELYDQYRPVLPVGQLMSVLAPFGVREGQSVLDLGCGTGLSTLAWRRHARQVVGADPDLDMLSIARAHAHIGQHEYAQFVGCRGNALPFAAGSFELTICAQAFHWMKPDLALAEIARVLIPGGVLALVDYDLVPSIGSGVEHAMGAAISEAEAAAETDPEASPKWPKSKHLANLKNSGLFARADELSFTATAWYDADTLTGFLNSLASVQFAERRGYDRACRKIDVARAFIAEELSEGMQSAQRTYRVRVGVKS